MVFQRLHQNPHHIGCCARSGWWPCGSMGWCSKKLHQNPRPGRLVFSLLAVFQKLGWCSKKLSQNPDGSMGWCSKSWGGAPKSCPRIPTARWGGFPKVGVVLQKVVPESPRLDGVVFQKLGWCSKKLSQNPHGSIGWCSKSWGGLSKSCPRIPTLYTTDRNTFFASDVVRNYNSSDCQKVCEALTFLLDNIYIRFGSKL